MNVRFTYGELLAILQKAAMEDPRVMSCPVTIDFVNAPEIEEIRAASVGLDASDPFCERIEIRVTGS